MSCECWLLAAVFLSLFFHAGDLEMEVTSYNGGTYTQNHLTEESPVGPQRILGECGLKALWFYVSAAIATNNML